MELERLILRQIGESRYKVVWLGGLNVTRYVNAESFEQAKRLFCLVMRIDDDSFKLPFCGPSQGREYYAY